MSMISELVDRFGVEAVRAADAIVMLSEKAREPKQGEWIPCEERLPEENGYYLTFMDYGSCEVLHWYNGWNCYPCASENEIEDDVLAWMPLPKPWKGTDDHQI